MGLGSLLCLILAAGVGVAFDGGENHAAASVSDTIGGLPVKPEEHETVAHVDVYVRDEDGEQVKGLTAEAFRVFLDDEQKSIETFASFSAGGLPGESQTTSAQGESATDGSEESVADPTGKLAPQSVYIVIFVDNNHLHVADRNRVLSALRGFVSQVAGPSVRISVVSHSGSIEVLQPFTFDKREILAALRDARTLEAAGTDKAEARGRILQEIHRTFDSRTTTRNQGQGVQQLFGAIGKFLEETSLDVDQTISSLREVTTMVGGFAGRKCLIYISNGLPMVPGKDLDQELAVLVQNREVRTMASRLNKRNLIQAAASAAAGHGVAIYTIDATGDDPTPGTFVERTVASGTASTVNLSNNQEPLRLLADRSGGLAILKTDDFAAGLTQIQENLFTYYTIGYAIHAAGGDRVHRLSVTLPEHPGHDLRYGRTFVEKSLESKVQDRVVANLILGDRDNPLQIAAEVGQPATAATDQWILPVSVSFPTHAVALEPDADDYVGSAVLFLALIDVEGGQVESQRRDHEIRIPAADYEQLREQRRSEALRLLVGPGTYNISVGVLDPLTRQTSFETVKRVVVGEH